LHSFFYLLLLLLFFNVTFDIAIAPKQTLALVCSTLCHVLIPPLLFASNGQFDCCCIGKTIPLSVALMRSLMIAIAPRTRLHLLSQHVQAHGLFASHQVQAHKLKLHAIALRKGNDNGS
jgi:hypothetical protein